ncbi:uncharacterized protein LOC123272065 [Cotesia glomerata]|uniref:uncharacterized protein LOC123272065 n=1 Tax=Cotesia glomerata TaxID=32391 RepID=UPI001D00F5F5|nr:uncharacterized protein LOC123272065 [Cotesia glomerata]
MDTYTASDHNAILWEILNAQSPRRPKKQLNTIGWKVKTLDPRALLVALNSDQIIAGCAEEKTKDLMKRVTQACDASMSRRRGINTSPQYCFKNNYKSSAIIVPGRLRHMPQGRDFPSEVEAATTSTTSKREKATRRTVILSTTLYVRHGR